MSIASPTPVLWTWKTWSMDRALRRVDLAAGGGHAVENESHYSHVRALLGRVLKAEQ